MNIHKTFIAGLIFFFTFIISINSQNYLPDVEGFKHFKTLISNSDIDIQSKSIKWIDEHWKSEYEIMILELFYFKVNQSSGHNYLNLLEKKTKQKFGYDFNKWYEWIWNKEEQLTNEYHEFKAELHKNIDFHFSKYFLDRQNERTIRLDEIRWGGVLQDGIPPLRNPKMILANKARYLEDDNVVFGVEINGDFRAYPKRILAWHEMFTDDIGGISVAGVYCTLCGTVILYKTEHSGIKYKMGTSGFLYRSNKLMYDKKTQSLWNTLWGKPVVGPLVDKGIEFEYLSVITTTWGEWKRRHPETTVLALNTGFRRDYGEGVAYQNYFATDELMFNVPEVNKKLKNKQSILAIRFPELQEEPLAISVKYLEKHPIYEDKIGTQKFVVLTDNTGANRVYERNNESFKNYDKNITAIDIEGEKWTVYENRLEDNNGNILRRINTFNAFWFGWQSAYPNTRLVK
ncbi:DUF3179 domain-containing protein [Flavobacteriaceae bacterium AU392]|nr:DUF3179 domain-containing protein [Flavobacteriaceae bacterium]RKM85629.1 DUF3179 domain-containing protein [Flavobacteriaceae bacterium AU392]